MYGVRDFGHNLPNTFHTAGMRADHTLLQALARNLQPPPLIAAHKTLRIHSAGSTSD